MYLLHHLHLTDQWNNFSTTRTRRKDTFTTRTSGEYWTTLGQTIAKKLFQRDYCKNKKITTTTTKFEVKKNACFFNKLKATGNSSGAKPKIYLKFDIGQLLTQPLWTD